jgi:hypothetical protein
MECGESENGDRLLFGAASVVAVEAWSLLACPRFAGIYTEKLLVPSFAFPDANTPKLKGNDNRLGVARMRRSISTAERFSLCSLRPLW